MHLQNEAAGSECHRAGGDIETKAEAARFYVTSELTATDLQAATDRRRPMRRRGKGPVGVNL